MSARLSLDVRRRFPGGPEIRAVLDEPLDPGRVLVLFGPSGSGKTTVLRAVAGLDRLDGGSVRFAGETWSDVAANVHVPPQARRAGFLFQEYALFPHMDVAANVGYGVSGLPPGERRLRVEESARLLRIEDLLHRRPGQLSGGQRQRVALARALAPHPRLLLLDEPLSALDGPTREELRGELRGLLHRLGIPSVVVTHDRAEALTLGDRLAVLADGVVRQVGPVDGVFSSPADPVVARVVGTENVLHVRVASRDEGLAVAELAGARLVGVDPGGLGTEAFACIRAEEVVLEPEGAAGSSPRNRLAATVEATALEGPLVRVTLDCGFRLVALVTRQAAAELGLAPGARVVARVKAPAVRLVPRAVAERP
ncbi:MAG TPA: ABC transporter ATP-binding protein [Anaeromyxobacteraceae bacterium]|nr:ABC transporter ATP-binding protein [Anaeromyxobacteraceae bacterium]